MAYQLGPQSPPIYALEGSIAVAGTVIQWLKDHLEILHEIKECEAISKQLIADDQIVFVPAFAGLYAPYWCENACRLVNFIKMHITEY